MRSALLSGVLGVLLGAGVVWLNGGGKGKPGPAETPAAQAAPVEVAGADRVAAPIVGAMAVQAAIHEAVEEGVRAAVREGAAEAAAAKAAAAAPDAKPSPAPTASFARGRAHVTERLAQGAWTEADRDRMRDLLGEMNDQERMDLMKQVIVAVNKGLVKVELDGPVF